MLKWKSSWNKSCRSRKTEQSWYSKVFHLTSGTVGKLQLTSFSGRKSPNFGRNHRNFGRNSSEFRFLIWILFPFGISEIWQNFGRNFVSGNWRDSVKKRKGKPCSDLSRARALMNHERACGFGGTTSFIWRTAGQRVSRWMDDPLSRLNAVENMTFFVMSRWVVNLTMSSSTIPLLKKKKLLVCFHCHQDSGLLITSLDFWP